MTTLRSFAILLLVLVLLPWGAFASQSNVQQPAIANLSYADLSMVMMENDVGTATVTVSANAKRCRFAGLIGSACSPDITIPRSTLPRDPVVTRNVVPRADDTRLVGATPSTALDPPRFC